MGICISYGLRYGRGVRRGAACNAYAARCIMSTKRRVRTPIALRPALRARGPCVRQACKGGSGRRGVAANCGFSTLTPYGGMGIPFQPNCMYGRNAMRPALRARGPCGRQAGKGESGRRGVAANCGFSTLNPYRGMGICISYGLRYVRACFVRRRGVMRPYSFLENCVCGVFHAGFERL